MLFIGVDLGRSRDFTAVSLLEKIPPYEQAAYLHARTQEEKKKIQTLYHLRFADRLPLGTPYPVIIEYVKKFTEQARQAGDSVQLVVDATGCGCPVLDQLRKEITSCRVVGVLIHGGAAVTRIGIEYGVPKRALVSTMQLLLQSGRLQFAAEIPKLAVL